MAETSRGQQLVFLATRPRYHVAKLLQLNIIINARAEDVKSSEDKNLSIVNYNGKDYHAVIFDSGDYVAMELTRDKLKDYENVVNQYKGLGFKSQGVQTENENSDENDNEAAETAPTLTELFPAAMKTLLQDETAGGLQDEATGGLQDEATGGCSFQEDDYNRVAEQLLAPQYKDPQPSTSDSVTASQPRHEEDFPGECSYGIHEKIAEQLLAPQYKDPQPSTSDSVTASQPRHEEDFPGECSYGIHEKSQQVNVEKPQRKRNMQFCIFCKKLTTQLPRHILVSHRTEERVKSILHLPIKDKTRFEMFATFRREGNAQYNSMLAAEGKMAIPIRKSKYNEYYACPHCGAFFSTKGLARHYGICTGRKVPRNLQTIVKSQSKIIQTQQTPVSDLLKKEVLTGMRSKDNDTEDIVTAITSDQDIVVFGNAQCKKYAAEINLNRNQIRRKLRLLASIRQEISKIDDSVHCIGDILDPEKWNAFINAVEIKSGFNHDTITFKSPNVVGEVGMLMTHIAKDIKAKSPMDEEGRKKRERIQAWIELFERAYNTTLGSQAAKAATKNKYVRRNFQPIAKDIVLLNNYLKKTLKTSLEKLEEEFSTTYWEWLNITAMLLLLTFNRKRIGEVQNFTVEDYKRKSKIQKNTDIYEGLSETEKIIAERYYHVVIRGKLARGVPVLIDDSLATAIDKIIEYRPLANVSPDNPYLFAKGKNGYFNGSVAMKDAAFDCGAEEPALLTSTRLRKHIATVSQALNLTDSDLNVLSGFLGHTTQTHLEHYRLPSDAVHTAKVSRLLMALDQGTISNFKGKTIEEIDVNIPIPDFEDEHPDDPLPLQQIEIDEEERQLKTPSPPKKGRSIKSIRRKPFPLSTPSPKKNKRRRLIVTPSPSPRKIIVTPSPSKRKRIRWSSPEKTIMRKAFAHHLKNKTLPSLTECKLIRNSNRELESRRVIVIKAWVNNEIRRERLME